MTPPGSGPSEMCARIREARRRLPLDQRVVLCLRDGEGLTEEAAAVPETSLDSVRVRLHRARMALRERLGRSVLAVRPALSVRRRLRAAARVSSASRPDPADPGSASRRRPACIMGPCDPGS